MSEIKDRLREARRNKGLSQAGWSKPSVNRGY